MATAPVLDPIESRSIGQDAATRRFQRLERVRARQRARRRRRWILITTLVVALAGTSVLGFTAVRRASFDRRDQAPPPAPVAVPAPPAAETIATPPAITPRPGVTPAPTRADEVKRDATPPSPPRPDSPRSGATAPTRSEPPDADGTAAIDWLLKTSRPAGQ
jgi:hypothetical protein